MRGLASCVLLVLVAVLLGPAGPARIQDGSADVCWSPDNEFPVPCDEDEE